MREELYHGLDSLVPCNEPLAMGVDHPVRFAGPKDNLQLPNALCTLLIVGEAVLSQEDMVEVDSPPSD